MMKLCKSFRASESRHEASATPRHDGHVIGTLYARICSYEARRLTTRDGAGRVGRGGTLGGKRLATAAARQAHEHLLTPPRVSSAATRQTASSWTIASSLAGSSPWHATSKLEPPSTAQETPHASRMREAPIHSHTREETLPTACRCVTHEGSAYVRTTAMTEDPLHAITTASVGSGGRPQIAKAVALRTKGVDDPPHPLRSGLGVATGKQRGVSGRGRGQSAGRRLASARLACGAPGGDKGGDVQVACSPAHGVKKGRRRQERRGSCHGSKSTGQTAG